MVLIHPQYITDAKGRKISVVLAMQEFKNIMEELEELEEVRLFDEATADKEPAVPIDEAFAMIEARRANNK